MFNEMVRAEIWLQDTLNTQQTIEQLANRVGYSASQTRRRFRQCFGMSPSAYRDRLRLEQASRLLAHTPLGISEIARRCGYLNHSSFSRAFQRHYRLTPRDYRQARLRELRRSAAALPQLDGVALRQLPPRTGLVSRRYAAVSTLPPSPPWAGEENGGYGRLKGAPAIALVHGDERHQEMPRIDVGVVLPPRKAARLAVPPTSRLVELPATRCACVALPSLESLPQILDKLLGEALAAAAVHYSGEPMRLLQQRQGLELQVPLLSYPAAP